MRRVGQKKVIVAENHEAEKLISRFNSQGWIVEKLCGTDCRKGPCRYLAVKYT